MAFRIFLLLIPILAGLPLSLNAAEVDQFTRNDQPLADSRAVLNAEVMAYLAQAVKVANRLRPLPPKVHPGSFRREPGCSAGRLYSAVSWELARSVVGQIESFAEQDGRVDKRRIPFADSIYQNFLWPQSPTLVLSERVAAVIRIGNVETGTDKLGHFFTEGHSYFRVTDELGSGPEQGLLFGEWSESVYFGAQTTGVFSFADLTANFNGLRFWNRLLARQPDPLTGQVPEPYIRCQSNRWVVSGAFDWADYVDDGWDESINCPLLRTPDMLAMVLARGPLCRAGQLPVRHYGVWSARLLNNMGLAVLPDYLQPEVIFAQRRLMSDLHLPLQTPDYIRSLRQQLDVWRQQQVLNMNEENE